MLTLYLRLDQRDALKAIAQERQMAVADVTREAIREYLTADAARRSQQEPAAA